MTARDYHDHDAEVAELQSDLERARNEQWHPCLIDAREALLLEAQHRQAIEHDQLYRLRKAILLAPTIDICEALLRGEPVPLERLNQTYLRRLGRAA